MSTFTTNCADCEFSLPNDPLGNARTPCPNCGSVRRGMTEAVEERIVFREGHHVRVKRPSLPSKDKLRADAYARDEPSHKHGKTVRAEREIDRDTDTYRERITDIESGEVLHECDEPLSDHFGHGSAKGKPKGES